MFGAEVVQLHRQLRAHAEQVLQLLCLRKALELGNRLLHPAEHDPRALALERHRHDTGASLEPELAELQRSAEHEGGAEDRMAGELQLGNGREDADACVAPLLGREHEDRLGEVHLLRELLHRLVVDIASVREDGQLVAGQRSIREDVGHDVTEGSHAGSLRRRFDEARARPPR